MSRDRPDSGFLRNPRTELLVVGGVVLLALVLRVIYVLQGQDNPSHHVPVMDSDYNVSWARALVAGEEFQPGPFFRAPLYIWFLAGTFAVFGPENLLAPRLLQCLFGTATVLLVYLVGKRAFDRRVGLFAALLAAVYWVLIYFDGELLIPTLIIPLDLLAIWLTLGLTRQSPRRAPLLAGLVWGLSAIARPNVLAFMPVLALWLWWQHKGTEWRRGILATALLTLGCIAPIAPITTYNAVRGDDLVLIASQAGVNLWIGNNPDSDGATAIVPGTRGGWWQGYRDAIALAEAAEGRPLKASEVSAHYSRRAWAFLLGEPSASIPLLLRKLELFVKDWEISNNQHIRFFARQWSPVTHLPLSWGVIAPLGLLGLLLCIRRGRLLPLWGFVLVYSGTVVAFFICARFRIPVAPPLLVLGAHAAVLVWDRVRAGRPAWLLVVAAALAGTVYSLTPAANIRTNDSTGHLQLGLVEAARGNRERALQSLERAVAIDPDNVHALVGLARTLAEVGRRADAIERLQQARAVRPDEVDTLEQLVKLLALEGRLAEADAVGQAAMQIHPEHPLLLFQLAQVRRQQGRPGEAIALYERALQSNPKLFNAAYSIGLLHQQAGRVAAAIDAFTRAVAVIDRAAPPFDDQVFEALIRLLVQTGDSDTACRRAREYAARKPDNPRAQALVQQLCR